MENRRGIRNWDAFGTLYNFASRMLATELLEPVLKFTFDLSAALLLGVTFIFQSLSVLIALDVVVLSFYQVTCTYLCGILSALMMFIASERERTATVRSLIKYFTNIMWVKIIYTVHPDCWTYMSGGPILAGALMHTLVGFYTERLNTEQSLMTQTLYSLFLLTLFLIVFNTIYLAPDHILLETVFMLRCPIDTLCSAADTIFKLCDNALGVDNRIPVYTTQIARYSFWSAVHLLQFLLINTTNTNTSTTTANLGRRADKYIYFFLFLHDLLELAVPVRLVLVQISNERYITKTFPKLSAVELSAVCDETCPVCLSEHTRDTVRLRCNHLLHAGCLHSILRQNSDTQQHSRCPMCRADIDITPPRTSSGIFGSGMRGLRARTTRPMYRTVNNPTTTNTTNGVNTIQATASGRFGTAEQLIADHLQQHNLQQGDVIHIRIIPRGSRASVSTGTGTSTNVSANASMTNINAAATAATSNTIGTSTSANTSTSGTNSRTNITTRPQPLVPSTRPVYYPRMTTTTTSTHINRANSTSTSTAQLTTINTNTTTSTNTNTSTNTMHPSPSQLMEVALQQAEHTSVLRTIHAHGLHTDSEHSSTGSMGAGISGSCTDSNSGASTAMDVDNNNTTNINDTASISDFLTNDEIQQLLFAADSAINNNTNTTATNNASSDTIHHSSVSFDTNANLYCDSIVQEAVDDFTPLPLAHDTTRTTNTTYDTSYEQTQVDSQSDMRVHINSHYHHNSDISTSGSGSSDSSDSGNSDEVSVADTACSSDDECESVDLFHHITTTSTTGTSTANAANISNAVIPTDSALSTSTSNSDTTDTPVNTTTTPDNTTCTSPSSALKRKHSVVDLVSPPDSPVAVNNNTSGGDGRGSVRTPERVSFSGSSAGGTSVGVGSATRSGGKRVGGRGSDVKEEPAAKIPRLDGE